MNQSLKSKARLLAATALANGDLEDIELKFISDIAEDLEVEKEQLVNEVKKAADELRAIEDPEKFDQIIYEEAKNIQSEDKLYFYQIILGLIMCDNVFDVEEVAVASLIAKALNLEIYEIITSVATLVKANKQLEVAVDDI